MSRSQKEGLLSRWSRRKLETAHAAGEAQAFSEDAAVSRDDTVRDAAGVDAQERADAQPRTEAGPVELPSIDELGPESDFRAFMDPQVDDSLRRAALKKMFRDPQFNVTDGLDVYAEDYSKLESLTPAMVVGLKHARSLLFGEVDAGKQADIADPPINRQRRLADEASNGATSVADNDDIEPRNSERVNGEVKDAATQDVAGAIAPPQSGAEEA